MKSSIFINGYSLECALGKTLEQAGEKLFAENADVSSQKHPDLGIPFFAMEGFLTREYIHGASFFTCLEAVQNALKMAFPQTGIPPRELRIGCIVGTTGDVQFGDLEFYKALKEERPTDDKIYHFVHGTIAERIVQQYAFTGPALTVSNTCVSGADAVLTGAQWIEADLCDMVIALGVDLVSIMCLAGFYTLGAASLENCKPFDRMRSGMNVGEGCGCVILRRGELPAKYEKAFAPPEFKFSGGGSACDAYHMTAPHPEGAGLQKAIKKALEMSGVSPADLAFVNAHGTGTLANDSSETIALKETLGEKVPFFSTKGITGHTLGAAGILELIFTMLCLKKQMIPQSFGCEEAGEDIALSPNMQLRKISGSAAMSTSLAFGGYNTALIVERVTHASA